MKLRKSLFMCATLVVAVFAYRCSDDKLENVEPAEVQLTDMEKIKRLGLSTDGIQQEGEDYIVEGDIRITPEFLNEQNFSDLKQARSKNIVSCKNAKSIKVKIAYKKDGKPYKQAVAAIKKWNNLKGDILNFEIVTSKPDITIKSGKFDIVFGPTNGYRVKQHNLEVKNIIHKLTPGEAGFPSNGKPFKTVLYNNNLKKDLLAKIKSVEKEIVEKAKELDAIWINDILIEDWSMKKDFPWVYEDLVDKLDNDFGITVLMHELGHCIGLGHTNFRELPDHTEEIHIPDTPTKDKGSLMNGSAGLDVKPTFSKGDKKAIKKLYENMDAMCKDM